MFTIHADETRNHCSPRIINLFSNGCNIGKPLGNPPFWGSGCNPNQHTPLAIWAGAVADDLGPSQVWGAVKHLDWVSSSLLVDVHPTQAQDSQSGGDETA